MQEILIIEYILIFLNTDYFQSVLFVFINLEPTLSYVCLSNKGLCK